VSASTFPDVGVSAELTARLARAGITSPSPIQTATLPDALAGRDICGCSPTGSGKTIAFGLAIATRVAAAKPRRPRALVLVPTRELAAQVHQVVSSLIKGGDREVVANDGRGTVNFRTIPVDIEEEGSHRGSCRFDARVHCR